MRRFVAGLLLTCSWAGVQAKGQTLGMSLNFSMDRSGAQPSHFEIRVDQATGRGVYRAAAMAQTGDPAPAGAPASSATDTPIALQPPLVKKLFSAVAPVKAHHCESHNKGVAQTGTKTLKYVQDDRSVECTFNYSDDDKVNAVSDLLIAVAETMEYGDRLANKLRFDRLGLDVEMDNLQNAVQEGRAVGVGNIETVLGAIENDDRVMDRVRRKAAHLLEGAEGANGQGAAVPASER